MTRDAQKRLPTKPDDNGRNNRDLIHAAFYGLHLRQKGHTPAEAAALVIEAYPESRPQLEKLLIVVHDPLVERGVTPDDGAEGNRSTAVLL